MKLLFLLSLVALQSPVVLACSCIGPITLSNSLKDKQSTAVKVRIGKEIFPNGPLDDLGNGFRYFRATIQYAYRACNLRRNDSILVSTGGNSALCGITIEPQTSYLMFGFLQDEDVKGYGSQRVLQVGLCQYQIPFRQLTKQQRETLSRRRYQDNCPKVCDRKDCGAVPPVAPPYTCPDGSTAGTTINGCIDNGFGCQWDFKETVCPACFVDEDCSEQTFCSQGLCRTKGTCLTTADCFNPNNRGEAEPACVLDRECIGEVCDNRCCKNVVNCLVDPCDNVRVEFDTCVSDYCGGCNAYAFDQSGNQVN
jgi:hypothetical protein